MAKLFSTKLGLAINIPEDIAKELDLKKGDDFKFMIGKIDGKPALLLIKDESQQSNEKVEAKDQVRVSERELMLLKQITALKSNERTVKNIEAKLNNEEKETLNDLLRKGFIIKFKKANEEEERYTIPESIYEAISNGSYIVESAPADPIDIKYRELMDNGYTIIESENEAVHLSKRIEDLVKRGYILATRAFDRKYYIVKKELVERYYKKIISLLKESEYTLEQLAEKLDIDKRMLNAILVQLEEQGEILEVKKNVFKAV
ncbi:MAG: hypothetical protein ARM1_0244 [Candidatus Micrarchaeota archaeon]|nr:MAG: hypothetical protein ARM1_0244 [Candidatus Micrarchaeota archaeon]